MSKPLCACQCMLYITLRQEKGNERNETALHGTCLECLVLGASTGLEEKIIKGKKQEFFTMM